MQGVQINHSILEAIFIQQERLTPQIVKQILQWNQQLEPSVNMTQSIISAYLLPNHQTYENQRKIHQPNGQINEYQKNINIGPSEYKQNLDRLKKAVKDIPKTLMTLQKMKCPKNFLRAYLLFVKKNLSKFQHQMDRKYILEQWSKMAPELLQAYFDTFSIKIQKYSIAQSPQDKVQRQSPQDKVQGQNSFWVKAEDFDKKVFQLIQKKQYTQCMTLIKMSHCQKEHVNKLLSKMTNNKEASKAADYIKSLKLNPSDYPALGQRLYKNTARHFLTKNGWEYAEEIFETHPEALACVVEDLVFKSKYEQALSIWFRNQQCRKHIIKEQTLQYLRPYIQNKDAILQVQKFKENFLHKDQFGPTTRQKYFSLEDFGFRQQQVVWIDQNTKQTKQYMKDILESQILGIDTQSIVGQTKFDKSQHSKFEEAALIQIATHKKMYIIDGFTAKHIPSVKQAIMTYIKNNGLIVGHTLGNDMDCLLKSLGCSDEQIRNLKEIRLVDVCKLFKSVYPEQRFSSLAFITQTMLGKQLCKDQTLTNWQRRPLRRNQTHYAAMDALVVIKIYEKFVQLVGEQMIEYYCSMDASQF